MKWPLPSFFFFSQTEGINHPFPESCSPLKCRKNISLSQVCFMDIYMSMNIRSAVLDQTACCVGPVSCVWQRPKVGAWGRVEEQDKQRVILPLVYAQLQATPSWDFWLKSCFFECKNSSCIFLQWILPSCFLKSGKFKYPQLPVAEISTVKHPMRRVFYCLIPWEETLFSVVFNLLLTVYVS